MKNISILGSTGSIGIQTLDIVKNNPKEFKIIGLTANSNIKLLKKQIIEFNPEAVAVMDKEKADLLKKNANIDVYSGIDGIIKISKLNDADTVINSLVGSIGVLPTIEAIKSKKNIALANKETLVAAGQIVMEEVKKNCVNLMPIDSEHSAIFQCLNGELYNYSKYNDKNTIINKNNINNNEIRNFKNTQTTSGTDSVGNENKINFNNEINNIVNKIIITASGGPFRDYTKKQLDKVTVQDALNHPTWNMGSKITIDSATLMNKGFEVIEAHWLYGIDYGNIEVVIHPQSIIHSLVEFKDNSTLAQLSLPNMKIPIQYALSYPKRLPLETKKLNLTEIKSLDFEKPDFEKFPCLKYAYDAGVLGGTMPAVLNAANEVAVHSFLDKKIKFNEIPIIIKKMMDSHNVIKNPNLSQILEIDKKIREETKNIIKN